MIVEDRSVWNEISAFAKDHKLLCVGTLGIALLFYSLGKMAGRTVSWLRELVGTTKKVDDVAIKALEIKTDENRKKSKENLTEAEKVKKEAKELCEKADKSLAESTKTYYKTLKLSYQNLDKLNSTLKELDDLKNKCIAIGAFAIGLVTRDIIRYYFKV